jgi:hypothetical protein
MNAPSGPAKLPRQVLTFATPRIQDLYQDVPKSSPMCTGGGQRAIFKAACESAMYKVHSEEPPDRYRGLHRHVSTAVALSNRDVHTRLSRNHQIHTRIPYVDDQGPSGRPYRAKGQELRGRTRPREWLRGPQVPYGFAFRVQQPWTRAAKWVIVLRQNWERIWSETV